MKAIAERGVCIGPARHLARGEVAEIEPALFSYLQSIGAVKAAPAVDQDTVQPVAPEKPARKEK
jgi:hypothetical protein